MALKLNKFLWGGLDKKLTGQGAKVKNPAEAAIPYTEKSANIYNPYVQQGQQAREQLNPIYSQMLQDPNAYYNMIADQYKQSPGFEAKKQSLLSDAESTAAAGGFVGGQAHQKGALGIVDALMNQDFQNWYNNVMGINKTGIEGQQHAADIGFDAAGNQANVYNQQGALAYKGQDWKNRQNQERMNQLLKFLGTGGGAIAGGLAGGPAGAATGAQIGSNFF